MEKSQKLIPNALILKLGGVAGAGLVRDKKIVAG